MFAAFEENSEMSSMLPLATELEKGGAGSII